MKLSELNAQFVGSGGEGITHNGQPVPYRHGIAVMMECPCRECDQLLCVPFSNPLDGGPPEEGWSKGWHREGDTIDTLTLQPSVQRMNPPELGGCRWHGFITNGEAVTC